MTGIRPYRLLLEVLRLDCHAPQGVQLTLITSDGMREERMQDLETSSLPQYHTPRHGPAHSEGSKKR